MTPPADVARPVEPFEEHRRPYRWGHNKAQLRPKFLHPRFEALGSDTHHRKGVAAAYKEPMQEATIKIGGGSNAPHYCFRTFFAAKRASLAAPFSMKKGQS